ncbi:unknown protein [Azorhizobium caulinodans ORS 571]|uniref:Uncharacterized protein n=1 Tax=Azorhizobium caulinodans (strain ATCC 43989 / DSM 5975 / JCM 20966 / LMG 6465 / NBRC 14845 / NCIMB 13405 / ORS 571) TaxID=438753 RepID=A8HTK8_AZOC5|nr:hypothetical protein [Azorhizobium caulinodans]BAF86845.1 unknown protein [Azorhizobium caulinodans ORS 571]
MSLQIPALTEKDPFKLAQAIRELAVGRSNAVGTCTLTPGAALTTVAAVNCAPGSVVFLMPTTATAATATGLYAVAAAGSFTVHHDVSSATDRTFGYVALG